MRILPLEPSVEPLMEPQNVQAWAGGRYANPAAAGTFGGAPYGATKRVRGVPKLAAGRHATPAAGAFGGAQIKIRATKRARVCRNGLEDAMRTLPLLGPSVELPIGARSV